MLAHQFGSELKSDWQQQLNIIIIPVSCSTINIQQIELIK